MIIRGLLRGVAGYDVPIIRPVAANGNDANTVLLLHMDGANASTTFTDSAIGGAAPHTVTPVNGAKIDTSQSVFGGASAVFSTVGPDYLTLDGSADFAFGTGDWTADFRLRISIINSAILYDGRPSAGSGFYPTIYISGTTLTYFDNGADRITGATLSQDTWYHVAVVRSGSTIRMYLDGTQTGSDYTTAGTYLNPASRPSIASSGFSLGSANLAGWIDELRVSNNARWTSNFTPPVAAYS
jgi:hypothetical protein